MMGMKAAAGGIGGGIAAGAKLGGDGGPMLIDADDDYHDDNVGAGIGAGIGGRAGGSPNAFAAYVGENEDGTGSKDATLAATMARFAGEAVGAVAHKHKNKYKKHRQDSGQSNAFSGQSNAFGGSSQTPDPNSIGHEYWDPAWGNPGDWADWDGEWDPVWGDPGDWENWEDWDETGISGGSGGISPRNISGGGLQTPVASHGMEQSHGPKSAVGKLEKMKQKKMQRRGSRVLPVGGIKNLGNDPAARSVAAGDSELASSWSTPYHNSTPAHNDHNNDYELDEHNSLPKSNALAKSDGLSNSSSTKKGYQDKPKHDEKKARSAAKGVVTFKEAGKDAQFTALRGPHSPLRSDSQSALESNDSSSTGRPELAGRKSILRRTESGRELPSQSDEVKKVAGMIDTALGSALAKTPGTGMGGQGTIIPGMPGQGIIGGTGMPAPPKTGKSILSAKDKFKKATSGLLKEHKKKTILKKWTADSAENKEKRQKKGVTIEKHWSSTKSTSADRLDRAENQNESGQFPPPGSPQNRSSRQSMRQSMRGGDSSTLSASGSVPIPPDHSKPKNTKLARQSTATLANLTQMTNFGMDQSSSAKDIIDMINFETTPGTPRNVQHDQQLNQIRKSIIQSNRQSQRILLDPKTNTTIDIEVEETDKMGNYPTKDQEFDKSVRNEKHKQTKGEVIRQSRLMGVLPPLKILNNEDEGDDSSLFDEDDSERGNNNANSNDRGEISSNHRRSMNPVSTMQLLKSMGTKAFQATITMDSLKKDMDDLEVKQKNNIVGKDGKPAGGGGISSSGSPQFRRPPSVFIFESENQTDIVQKSLTIMVNRMQKRCEMQRLFAPQVSTFPIDPRIWTPHKRLSMRGQIHMKSLHFYDNTGYFERLVYLNEILRKEGCLKQIDRKRNLPTDGEIGIVYKDPIKERFSEEKIPVDTTSDGTTTGVVAAAGKEKNTMLKDKNCLNGYFEIYQGFDGQIYKVRLWETTMLYLDDFDMVQYDMVFALEIPDTDAVLQMRRKHKEYISQQIRANPETFEIPKPDPLEIFDTFPILHLYVRRFHPSIESAIEHALSVLAIETLVCRGPHTMRELETMKSAATLCCTLSVGVRRKDKINDKFTDASEHGIGGFGFIAPTQATQPTPIKNCPNGDSPTNSPTNGDSPTNGGLGAGSVTSGGRILPGSSILDHIDWRILKQDLLDTVVDEVYEDLITVSKSDTKARNKVRVLESIRKISDVKVNDGLKELENKLKQRMIISEASIHGSIDSIDTSTEGSIRTTLSELIPKIKNVIRMNVTKYFETGTKNDDGLDLYSFQKKPSSTDKLGTLSELVAKVRFVSRMDGRPLEIKKIIQNSKLLKDLIIRSLKISDHEINDFEGIHNTVYENDNQIINENDNQTINENDNEIISDISEYSNLTETIWNDELPDDHNFDRDDLERNQKGSQNTISTNHKENSDHKENKKAEEKLQKKENHSKREKETFKPPDGYEQCFGGRLDDNTDIQICIPKEEKDRIEDLHKTKTTNPKGQYMDDALHDALHREGQHSRSKVDDIILVEGDFEFVLRKVNYEYLIYDRAEPADKHLNKHFEKYPNSKLPTKLHRKNKKTHQSEEDLNMVGIEKLTEFPKAYAERTQTIALTRHLHLATKTFEMASSTDYLHSASDDHPHDNLDLDSIPEKSFIRNLCDKAGKMVPKFGGRIGKSDNKSSKDNKKKSKDRNSKTKSPNADVNQDVNQDVNEENVNQGARVLTESRPFGAFTREATSGKGASLGQGSNPVLNFKGKQGSFSQEFFGKGQRLSLKGNGKGPNMQEKILEQKRVSVHQFLNTLTASTDGKDLANNAIVNDINKATGGMDPENSVKKGLKDMSKKERNSDSEQSSDSRRSETASLNRDTDSDEDEDDDDRDNDREGGHKAAVSHKGAEHTAAAEHDRTWRNTNEEYDPPINPRYRKKVRSSERLLAKIMRRMEVDKVETSSKNRIRSSTKRNWKKNQKKMLSTKENWEKNSSISNSASSSASKSQESVASSAAASSSSSFIKNLNSDGSVNDTHIVLEGLESIDGGSILGDKFVMENELTGVLMGDKQHLKVGDKHRFRFRDKSTEKESGIKKEGHHRKPQKPMDENPLMGQLGYSDSDDEKSSRSDSDHDKKKKLKKKQSRGMQEKKVKSNSDRYRGKSDKGYDSEDSDRGKSDKVDDSEGSDNVDDSEGSDDSRRDSRKDSDEEASDSNEEEESDTSLESDFSDEEEYYIGFCNYETDGDPYSTEKFVDSIAVDHGAPRGSITGIMSNNTIDKSLAVRLAGSMALTTSGRIGGTNGQKTETKKTPGLTYGGFLGIGSVAPDGSDIVVPHDPNVAGVKFLKQMELDPDLQEIQDDLNDATSIGLPLDESVHIYLSQDHKEFSEIKQRREEMLEHLFWSIILEDELEDIPDRIEHEILSESETTLEEIQMLFQHRKRLDIEFLAHLFKFRLLEPKFEKTALRDNFLADFARQVNEKYYSNSMLDPDLLTVALEYAGVSEMVTQKLFGKNMFNTAKEIYMRVQQPSEKESGTTVGGERPAFLGGLAWAEAEHNKRMHYGFFFKAWLDGTYFLFFIIYNLLALTHQEMTLFSGIQYTALDVGVRGTENLAALIALLNASWVNGFIGAISSTYSFLHHHEALITILVRFFFLISFIGLVGGISMCLFVEWGMSGTSKNPDNSQTSNKIGFGLLATSFIIDCYWITHMFTVYGFLYITHIGSIWSSPEGLLMMFSVLFSQLIMNFLCHRDFGLLAHRDILHKIVDGKDIPPEGGGYSWGDSVDSLLSALLAQVGLKDSTPNPPPDSPNMVINKNTGLALWQTTLTTEKKDSQAFNLQAFYKVSTNQSENLGEYVNLTSFNYTNSHSMWVWGHHINCALNVIILYLGTYFILKRRTAGWYFDDDAKVSWFCFIDQLALPEKHHTRLYAELLKQAVGKLKIVKHTMPLPAFIGTLWNLSHRYSTNALLYILTPMVDRCTVYFNETYYAVDEVTAYERISLRCLVALILAVATLDVVLMHLPVYESYLSKITNINLTSDERLARFQVGKYVQKYLFYLKRFMASYLMGSIISLILIAADFHKDPENLDWSLVILFLLAYLFFGVSLLHRIFHSDRNYLYLDLFMISVWPLMGRLLIPMFMENVIRVYMYDPDEGKPEDQKSPKSLRIHAIFQLLTMGYFRVYYATGNIRSFLRKKSNRSVNSGDVVLKQLVNQRFVATTGMKFIGSEFNLAPEGAGCSCYEREPWDVGFRINKPPPQDGARTDEEAFYRRIADQNARLTNALKSMERQTGGMKNSTFSNDDGTFIGIDKTGDAADFGGGEFRIGDGPQKIVFNPRIIRKIRPPSVFDIEALYTRSTIVDHIFTRKKEELMRLYKVSQEIEFYVAEFPLWCRYCAFGVRTGMTNVSAGFKIVINEIFLTNHKRRLQNVGSPANEVKHANEPKHLNELGSSQKSGVSGAATAAINAGKKRLSELGQDAGNLAGELSKSAKSQAKKGFTKTIGTVVKKGVQKWREILNEELQVDEDDHLLEDTTTSYDLEAMNEDERQSYKNILMEIVLHEFYENVLGYSHSMSVQAELLVGKSLIPERVSLQLDIAREKELRYMYQMTNFWLLEEHSVKASFKPRPEQIIAQQVLCKRIQHACLERLLVRKRLAMVNAPEMEFTNEFERGTKDPTRNNFHVPSNLNPFLLRAHNYKDYSSPLMLPNTWKQGSLDQEDNQLKSLLHNKRGQPLDEQSPMTSSYYSREKIFNTIENRRIREKYPNGWIDRFNDGMYQSFERNFRWINFYMFRVGFEYWPTENIFGKTLYDFIIRQTNLYKNLDAYLPKQERDKVIKKKAKEEEEKKKKKKEKALEIRKKRSQRLIDDYLFDEIEAEDFIFYFETHRMQFNKALSNPDFDPKLYSEEVVQSENMGESRFGKMRKQLSLLTGTSASSSTDDSTANNSSTEENNDSSNLSTNPKKKPKKKSKKTLKDGDKIDKVNSPYGIPKRQGTLAKLGNSIPFMPALMKSRAGYFGDRLRMLTDFSDYAQQMLYPQSIVEAKKELEEIDDPYAKPVSKNPLDIKNLKKHTIKVRNNYKSFLKTCLCFVCKKKYRARCKRNTFWIIGTCCGCVPALEMFIYVPLKYSIYNGIFNPMKKLIRYIIQKMILGFISSILKFFYFCLFQCIIPEKLQDWVRIEYKHFKQDQFDWIIEEEEDWEKQQNKQNLNSNSIFINEQEIVENGETFTRLFFPERFHIMFLDRETAFFGICKNRRKSDNQRKSDPSSITSNHKEVDLLEPDAEPDDHLVPKDCKKYDQGDDESKRKDEKYDPEEDPTLTSAEKRNIWRRIREKLYKESKAEKMKLYKEKKENIDFEKKHYGIIYKKFFGLKDKPFILADNRPKYAPGDMSCIGIDSGSWPCDGGGVGNCRKIIVEDFEISSKINWYMLSEVSDPSKDSKYPLTPNFITWLRPVFLCGVASGNPEECILFAQDQSYRRYFDALMDLAPGILKKRKTDKIKSDKVKKKMLNVKLKNTQKEKEIKEKKEIITKNVLKEIEDKKKAVFAGKSCNAQRTLEQLDSILDDSIESENIYLENGVFASCLKKCPKGFQKWWKIKNFIRSILPFLNRNLNPYWVDPKSKWRQVDDPFYCTDYESSFTKKQISFLKKSFLNPTLNRYYKYGCNSYETNVEEFCRILDIFLLVMQKDEITLDSVYVFDEFLIALHNYLAKGYHWDNTWKDSRVVGKWIQSITVGNPSLHEAESVRQLLMSTLLPIVYQYPIAGHLENKKVLGTTDYREIAGIVEGSGGIGMNNNPSIRGCGDRQLERCYYGVYEESRKQYNRSSNGRSKEKLMKRNSSTQTSTSTLSTQTNLSTQTTSGSSAAVGFSGIDPNPDSNYNSRGNPDSIKGFFSNKNPNISNNMLNYDSTKSVHYFKKSPYLPINRTLQVCLPSQGDLLMKRKSYPRGIVQASHHGSSALYGLMQQLLHDTRYSIWDHGLVWRERCLAIVDSEWLTPWMKSFILKFYKIVSCLVLFNADRIVPCNATFNGKWETHIGGLCATLPDCAHTVFARIRSNNNIIPVLNGLDSTKFQPAFEKETEIPHVIMLSHVYALKGIIFAIRAAEILVKDFQFTNFKFTICGSKVFDIEYTKMCENYILQAELSDKVTLAGPQPAPQVLPTAWIFLNSSLSEGLPLALGEAGCCGMPVVATDVGGTKDIVQHYGKIVPPQAPFALAKAIYELLSLTKVERRELGRVYREHVLASFNVRRHVKEMYLELRGQQLLAEV